MAMAKKGLKRSKTESSPSSIASSPASVTPSRSKRKFPLKRLLPRSKSAPPAADHDGEQTESIRSDNEQLLSPPVSPSRPSMRQGGGSRRSAAVDDGSPSKSALKDLQRVLKMIEDERHLVAHDLYLDAKRRIDELRDSATVDPQTRNNKKNRVWWKSPESSSSSVGGDGAQENVNEDEKACMFLQEKQDEFQALENRAKLFSSAKENLSIDDDWIHAQTLFGITTSYRRETDQSLSVKMEGELHGVPLFEQLVVLRECDLYSHWAPFMSKSKKLAQLDKLDVVAWYIVGVPLLGLTRDACYRAVGCDCMREEGSILLVGVGLNDTEEHGVKNALNEGAGGTGDDGGVVGVGERDGLNALQQQTIATSDSNLVDTTNSSFLARDAILSTIEIPPIPEGLGQGRMTIRSFAASIDILTPTAARTKMVVNVDPNLHLIPQFLIDFCMKRMCGILLTRLQSTARKVVKDPIKNVHARRMREDVRFYRDWLLPKFSSYCDEWGWQMPKVGAFEIEEDDLQAEGTGWIDDNIENEIQLPTPAEDASCLGSASYAGTTVSSSSTTSSAFGKLKNLVRRSESQEDRIAAARTRAAKRLQPKPFAESKVHRLNELKVAKQRAEERLRANSLDSSSADSVSSYSTAQTIQDVDVEGEVKRYVWILSGSLTIHTVLLLLGQYSFLNVSEWAGLAARESLDIIIVVLQAIALWALLNSVLLYAFDEIDFGQKKLVSNMNYGKMLFVKEVKKFSRIAAISVAMISCGYGFAEGSFRKLCSMADLDVLSTWRVCKSRERWGSRALDISSFITLRLGVFVMALMLMGHILLPKPEKKARKKAKKIDCVSSQTESISENCSVDASSLNRSRHSFGVSGNLSSMEVITEEEF